MKGFVIQWIILTNPTSTPLECKEDEPHRYLSKSRERKFTVPDLHSSEMEKEIEIKLLLEDFYGFFPLQYGHLIQLLIIRGEIFIRGIFQKWT